jgi:hypothetical protein
VGWVAPRRVSSLTFLCFVFLRFAPEPLNYYHFCSFSHFQQFGDQFVTTYRVLHHAVGKAYLERPGKNIQYEEFKDVFHSIWGDLHRYRDAASAMGRVLASAGSVESAERVIISIAYLGSTNHLIQPSFSSVSRQSSSTRAVLWSAATVIVAVLALIVRHAVQFQLFSLR